MSERDDMNPGDDTSDELTREYRRASAAEAGRPGPAVRAAILAEARAAASAPPPAANAPAGAAVASRRRLTGRHGWRVAASVLVGSVALLLWRQVDRGPQPMPAVLLDESAPRIQTDLAPAAPESAREAAPPPASESQAARQEEAPGFARSAPAAAAPSPEEPAFGTTQKAETMSARTAEPSGDARSSAGASSGDEAASRAVTVDLSVRAAAPETVITPPPPQPGRWVLQDAAGRVVRTGALQPGQDLGAITRTLQRDFPERRIGPFEVRNERNERGVMVPVGVARLE